MSEVTHPLHTGIDAPIEAIQCRPGQAGVEESKLMR